MATADPPVAIVAAEARELAGLVAHATSVTALQWPVRYALEAVIGDRRFLLLAHGAGTALAAHAARTAIDRAPVRALVSTGLCGALHPALNTGDLVIATETTIPGPSLTRFPAASPIGPAPRMAGPIVCSPRVASTRSEKAALHASGAIAVEMEAAGVAETAASAHLPFFCIKVVSDTADEGLPLDFNRFRDADGRFQPGRIAASALIHPFCLPALVSLFRASRQASVHLGDFLADCQF
jgi:adenosylhomocysteine nucleosidase